MPRLRGVSIDESRRPVAECMRESIIFESLIGQLWTFCARRELDRVDYLETA